jgi:hypothetical protein
LTLCIVLVGALGACSATSTQPTPRQEQELPKQPRVVASQPGIGDKCASRDWPAGSCRENKQCQYGCVAPIDVPPVYGDCPCPAGQVCYARWMGMGRKDWCDADCTKSGCREGFRCAANGRCELISCTEGYACKVQARCLPGKAGADMHGCVHLTCNGDRDCPCDAFCVLRQCYAKPGACQEPPMG